MELAANLVGGHNHQPETKFLRLVKEEPVGFPNPETARVAVIGLGYVGLPLTLGFSRNSRSIGFDINTQKIAELRAGLDFTGEVKLDELKNINADFTSDPKFLANADVIIVCVPTPVSSHYRPDYGPLLAASKTIGTHMKRGAFVVFESTVDPGNDGRQMPAGHRTCVRHEAGSRFSPGLFARAH